jgi:hypothetical protein
LGDKHTLKFILQRGSIMAKAKQRNMGAASQQAKIMVVSDALKQISGALAELKDSPALSKEVHGLLKQALDLPSDVFAARQAQLEETAVNTRRSMGEILRRIATEKNCEVEFRPPHGNFGCVRFFEQQPNTWRLSVLDDVPITIIETVNGEILANAAIEIILSIENVIAKAKAYAKPLETAYRTLQISTQFQFASPNILMLLLVSDKSLKAHLTSTTETPRNILSRAQMGYLLKAIKQENLLEISFRGATQHTAKEPHLHLSVPSILSPQKNPQSSPIFAVTIEVSK